MKRLTSWLAVGVCAVLLGFAFTPKAIAQDTSEQSSFNLTQPLDVGGTVLQPGDYQIKVVPLSGNRDMLQVTNADGTKVITTLLSIPHSEGPGGVQIPASRYVYYPAGFGHPQTLRTWFARNTPGLGGHDIVYPKQRAMELAVLAKEPVVAVPDEVKEAEYMTAPLYVVTPDKEVKPYAVVAAEKPAAPVVAPAEPVKVAENTKVAEHHHHKRLPRTASDVPLYAGLGLLSLLGALGLGVLARRVG